MWSSQVELTTKAILIAGFRTGGTNSSHPIAVGVVIRNPPPHVASTTTTSRYLYNNHLTLPLQQPPHVTSTTTASCYLINNHLTLSLSLFIHTTKRPLEERTQTYIRFLRVNLLLMLVLRDLPDLHVQPTCI